MLWKLDLNIFNKKCSFVNSHVNNLVDFWLKNLRSAIKVEHHQWCQVKCIFVSSCVSKIQTMGWVLYSAIIFVSLFRKSNESLLQCFPHCFNVSTSSFNWNWPLCFLFKKWEKGYLSWMILSKSIVKKSTRGP